MIYSVKTPAKCEPDPRINSFVPLSKKKKKKFLITVDEKKIEGSLKLMESRVYSLGMEHNEKGYTKIRQI